MDREKLDQDLKYFKNIEGVKAVILYGSRVEGRSHQKSDWDICLVAPEKDSWKVIKESWHTPETSREKYDVHTFEELPLKIKIRIIKNHKVLWKEKNFRIEEYLHRYRKIWNDSAKARGIA